MKSFSNIFCLPVLTIVLGSGVLSSCEEKRVPLDLMVRANLVDSKGIEYSDDFVASIAIDVDFELNGRLHSSRVVDREVHFDDSSSIKTQVKTDIRYIQSKLSNDAKFELKDYNVLLKLAPNLYIPAEFPKGKPSIDELKNKELDFKFKVSEIAVDVARGINHARQIVDLNDRDSALRSLAGDNSEQLTLGLCIAIALNTARFDSRNNILLDFAYRHASKLSGSDFETLVQYVNKQDVRDEIRKLAVHYSTKKRE